MDQPDRRQIGSTESIVDDDRRGDREAVTGGRRTDHDVEAAIPLSQDQHVQSAVFHEEESSRSPS
nr:MULTISPECIES: hypothetical protein [Methylobacterium]